MLQSLSNTGFWCNIKMDKFEWTSQLENLNSSLSFQVLFQEGKRRVWLRGGVRRGTRRWRYLAHLRGEDYREGWKNRLKCERRRRKGLKRGRRVIGRGAIWKVRERLEGEEEVLWDWNPEERSRKWYSRSGSERSSDHSRWLFNAWQHRCSDVGLEEEEKKDLIHFIWSVM